MTQGQSGAKAPDRNRWRPTGPTPPQQAAYEALTANKQKNYFE
jgi:hypothetical protein